MTATGRTVKVGSVELPESTDTLNFTVPPADKIKPEQAHLAGSKVEVSFSFPQVSSTQEAEAVCLEKEWDLVDFVNDALKAGARAAAYQAQAVLYKVSEVSAEDIKERMVRDYIRLGIAENVARAQVESLLAAK